MRVLGLGALEYALLAPATCITAIALLVMGVAKPAPALTLPFRVFNFWLPLLPAALGLRSLKAA